MRLFAIADPHLSQAQPKPMDVFGGNWTGHPQAFFDGWEMSGVTSEDLVLIPGDISWAMSLEDALLDLRAIAALSGQKILSRGNHDYWWPSISKLRSSLPSGMYALQNDALKLGDTAFCGTRGWTCPDSDGYTLEDEKIYKRELERFRLSLQAARKLEAARTVVLLHYPPTASNLHPTGFTALLEEFRPTCVVYGHLHGVNPERLLKEWEGVPLHFVAADALRFKPKLILERV